MNTTIKAPEEKQEITFETREQLAEYLGTEKDSAVVTTLWNSLKAGETTDQDIVKMAANR